MKGPLITDDLESDAARYRRLLGDPLLDTGVREALTELLADAEAAIAQAAKPSGDG